MVLKRVAAPLRTQALEAVREMILTGVYSPGDRLLEKELEEKLGVSRTVVREVIRQLESERLVTLSSVRGAAVAELSELDALHLYQVRAALEGTAVRLAALNARPDQIEGLRRSVDRISEVYDGESPVLEMLEVKDEFYAILVESSQNPVIGQLLENVQARIGILRRFTLSSAGRAKETAMELREIVEAIEDGNPALAEERCKRHVQNAQEIALASMAAMGGGI